MICSKCGHEFNGNFCTICGTPTPKSITCKKCGKIFDGIYCPDCGTSYSATPNHCLECGCSFFGEVCTECGMEKGKTTKIRCRHCGHLYKGRNSCPSCHRFNDESMKVIRIFCAIFIAFMLFVVIPMIMLVW